MFVDASIVAYCVVYCDFAALSCDRIRVLNCTSWLRGVCLNHVEIGPQASLSCDPGPRSWRWIYELTSHFLLQLWGFEGAITKCNFDLEWIIFKIWGFIPISPFLNIGNLVEDIFKCYFEIHRFGNYVFPLVSEW